MTQIEHIKEAIKHLQEAYDTYPDKDDQIRLYNDMLDGMIAMLKITVSEKYDD